MSSARPPATTRTLVLGGIRSGKSRRAVDLALAQAGDRVTFVATASEGMDQALDARIAEHRDQRPPGWLTVEAGDHLADALDSVAHQQLVLLDSLGMWVARLIHLGMTTHDAWPPVSAALLRRRAGLVIASDEVGLSMVPLTPQGRAFADALGWVNQQAADLADEVLLVIAGRTLALAR